MNIVSESEVGKTDQTQTHVPISVRKLLVKDYSIPTPVLEDPHFWYYFNMYGSLFHAKYARRVFTQMWESIGRDEDLFHSVRQRFIYDVTECIKQNDGYRDFAYGIAAVEQDPDLWKPDTPWRRDVGGSSFIKVDLVEANFQSLRYFNPSLVGGCSTWYDFVSGLTDHPYLVNSKSLRSNILGQCAPDKNVRIQRGLLHRVAREMMVLQDELSGGPLYQRSMGSDEFYLEVLPGREHYTLDRVRDVLSTCPIDARATLFKVRVLTTGSSEFFVTTPVGGEDFTFIPKLKNTPKFYVPQVVRYIRNEIPTDRDLEFMFEGQRARFTTPLWGREWRDCEVIRRDK